jgi:hypothetical protein
MSGKRLADDIAERIRRIETARGKTVILRPVRSTLPCFRGRVTEKRDCFVLEYRDDTPGFFWHHDILRELLSCIEDQRGRSVTLYDGDVQYVEAPVRSVRRGDHPSGRL